MTGDQLKQLEDDLWSAADNLRANSDLKASEYGTPVLGLIFLKFADINYRRHEAAIQAEFDKLKGTRREKPLDEIAVAKCGFYVRAAKQRYGSIQSLGLTGPSVGDGAKSETGPRATVNPCAWLLFARESRMTRCQLGVQLPGRGRL